MAPRNTQPIIVKKIIEDDHGSHHGGGWKVAYADFMTAMMAFFLLLWILAASDEEKLRGLADYFTPSLSEAGGRGEGMLDGQVLGPEGVMSGTDGPKSEVQLPSFGQENPLAVFDSRLRDRNPQVIVEYETRPEGSKADTTISGPASDPARDPAADVVETSLQQGASLDQVARDAERERAMAERDDTLRQLQGAIMDSVAQNAALKDMSDNLRFDRTAEGLDIQIVDQAGHSMFASGSAVIGDRTRALIRVIGEAIADLPNTLSLSGHTDPVPYSGAGTYSNWELSADRANATRRVLVDTGVNPSRITRISGLADTAPLDPANPGAPENRRISVTVNYPQPTH
ncbi:flagellar motor protein MotB [Brevirhabdus sp.]|uniref:flagellar motor protein MotB n=1 Tax=Brevirhabdus sp. TaxID=2004514 RepID=UPI004057CC5F